MFDQDGYIALTDFGLAKSLKPEEVAYSFCGTAEYMPPEIIDEEGHSYPVDWWALGILVYEMCIGQPPFYSNNQNKMYDLIKTKSLKFPNAHKYGINLSNECTDFIQKCLTKDPKNRIGS